MLDALPRPPPARARRSLGRVHPRQRPQLPRALLSVRDGARINAGTRPTTRQFADAERQLRFYVDAGLFAARGAEHLDRASPATSSASCWRNRTNGSARRGGRRAEQSARRGRALPAAAQALEPLWGRAPSIRKASSRPALGYLITGIGRASLLKGRSSTPARSAPPGAPPFAPPIPRCCASSGR